MATRRSTAPRKRPAPAESTSVSAPNRVVEGDGARRTQDGVSAGAEGALQAGVSELLRDFEAILEQDTTLDAQMREEMAAQLRQAMSEVRDAGFASATAPGSDDWAQAIHDLQASGELSEADAQDLQRRLDDALKPLERRETKLAIEFSRRMASDGEEQALEWLRRESAKSQNDQAQAAVRPPDRKPGLPLKTEVVNSRSRKLRGPPRA